MARPSRSLVPSHRRFQDPVGYDPDQDESTLPGYGRFWGRVVPDAVRKATRDAAIAEQGMAPKAGFGRSIAPDPLMDSLCPRSVAYISQKEVIDLGHLHSAIRGAARAGSGKIEVSISSSGPSSYEDARRQMHRDLEEEKRRRGWTEPPWTPDPAVASAPADSVLGGCVMYLVFCTAPVPAETVNRFLVEAKAGCERGGAYGAFCLVTSRDLSRIAHASRPPVEDVDSPFVGWTVEAVWRWVDEHCRRTDTGDRYTFAHNVIAILDGRTEADGTTCLLVSDAEDGAREMLRAEFSESLQNAIPIELDVMSLSEAGMGLLLTGEGDTLTAGIAAEMRNAWNDAREERVEQMGQASPEADEL